MYHSWRTLHWWIKSKFQKKKKEEFCFLFRYKFFSNPGTLTKRTCNYEAQLYQISSFSLFVNTSYVYLHLRLLAFFPQCKRYRIAQHMWDPALKQAYPACFPDAIDHTFYINIYYFQSKFKIFHTRENPLSVSSRLRNFIYRKNGLVSFCLFRLVQISVLCLICRKFVQLIQCTHIFFSLTTKWVWKQFRRQKAKNQSHCHKTIQKK